LILDIPPDRGAEGGGEVGIITQQNPDGSWSEAKPIPYYPNIVQRIAQWLKRMVKRNDRRRKS